MQNKQTAKQRNEGYHAARAVERERRRAACLTFVSKHDQKDYFITQQEFIQWVKITFGIRCDPMWVGSTSSPHFKGIHHTWLLETPQQIMLAKLTWT